jgi:hypothetical protein
LELHRWKDAASLTAPGVSNNHQSMTQWARAIGAARSGDVAAAQSAVKELTKSVEERDRRARKSGYNLATEKAIDRAEAEAWLALAQAKTDQALQELRAAADRQDKNGGDSVGIPAREMLLGHAAGGETMFRCAGRVQDRKNAPNRFDALLGAGRAAQASADATGAQTYYAKLTQVCPAGAHRPELAEAKTVLAQK